MKINRTKTYFFFSIAACFIILVFLFSNKLGSKKIFFDRISERSEKESELVIYYNYLKRYSNNSQSESSLKRITEKHFDYLNRDIEYTKLNLKDLKNKYYSDCQLFEKDQLIESAKFNHFKAPELNRFQLRKIFNRSKYVFVVDLIYIPEKSDKAYSEIKKEINNGADAFTINNKIKDNYHYWFDIGIKANRRSLHVGYLPINLEKKVFNLKKGEIKKITTTDGVYIVKVLDKIKSIHYKDSYHKETVKKLYSDNYLKRNCNEWKISKIEKNSNFLYDSLLLMDFTYKPLPLRIRKLNETKDSQNKIIAVLNNKSYTVAEIKNMINKLPQEIKLYFSFSQSSIYAIQTLLLLNDGNDLTPFLSAYCENMEKASKIEIQIEAAINSLGDNSDVHNNKNWLIDSLFCKIGDTTNILAYRSLENLLQKKFDSIRYKDKLKYKMSNVKNSDRYRELSEIDNSNAFPWLYPAAFGEQDFFYLDQELLSNILFNSEDFIIAKANKYQLDLKTLLSEFQKLSSETKKNIWEQKRLKEFVYFLLKDKVENVKFLINDQQIADLHIILERTNTDYYPFDDNNVAIIIDGIKITYGDLKERLFITRESIKQPLSKDYFVNVIDDIYWLKTGQQSEIKYDSIALYKFLFLRENHIDYNQYDFSSIYLKTLYNLLQEKFLLYKISQLN